MMSSGLSSTKPDIAAAVPVNEFSRLMTTGMSAPPIGRTIVTPNVSEAPRMTSSRSVLTSLPMAEDRRLAGAEHEQHGRRRAR